MEQQRFSSWVLERIMQGHLVRLRIGITKVGRHRECDLRLDKSVFVSRQHAEIHILENESISIKDLASSNGFYINSKLFKNCSAELQAGDKIGIGVWVDDDECGRDEYPIFILKSLSSNVAPRQAETLQKNSCDADSSGLANDNSVCFAPVPTPRQVEAPNSILSLPQPTSKESSKLSSSGSESPVVPCKNSKQESPERENETAKTCRSQEIIDKIEAESDKCNNQLPEQKIIDKKEENSVFNNEFTCLPIITDIVKQEKVNALSTDIENIFGGPDEVILEQVKKINPYVFSSLSKSSESSIAKVRNKPNAIETICISTDEEDEEDESNVADKTKIISNEKPNKTSDKYSCTRIGNEPISTETICIDDGNEGRTEGLDERECLSNAASNKMDNKSDNIPLPSASSKFDYDDDEDISFSQVMLDEMKAELDDVFITKIGDVEGEQNGVATTDFNMLKSFDNPEIIEEEEYDQELEIKVENWTEKLFSQTLSQLSAPQEDESNQQNSSCDLYSKFEDEMVMENEQNTSTPAGAVPDEEDSVALNDISIENNIKSTSDITTKTTHAQNSLNKDDQTFDRLKFTVRDPPSIIEPPHLPKNKGKLRGVSAGTADVTKKFKRIRDDLRDSLYQEQLKRKWLEKPSKSSEKVKEITKKLKEERKEKLKQVADQERLRESNKRKSLDNNQETEVHRFKKPKIKLTRENRGAFLTKVVEIDSSKVFKIPKIPKKYNVEKSQNVQDINTSTSTLSAIQSQTIPSTSHPPWTKLKSNLTQRKVALPPPTYKEKEAARASRTTNKITFSSMEINFQQTTECKEKLDKIKRQKNKRSKCQKKRVRFADKPIIYYIDAIGANRKVDRKDIMPMSRFCDRQHYIRRTYPIVDYTENIVSDILTWCTDWHRKKENCTNSQVETIYPMTNEFSSFENYKNVIFPLMKLEYLSILERAYSHSQHEITFSVRLESFASNKDRFILITKCKNIDKRINISSMDMVLLEFYNNISTIGLVSYLRKNGNHTIVIEIISTNFSRTHLEGNPSIKVRTIINNIRVEIGAFNAIYQLKSTPLFEKIIDPLKLLNNKTLIRKNIQYKGYDVLNTTQMDIVLEVYSKTIDEKTPNISLIQGPPGTGKTRMIVNLTLQILYGGLNRWLDKKVLICAQSNGAIDVIADKLYYIQQKMKKNQFHVIRFGKTDKISKNVINITLPKLIEKEQILKASNDPTYEQSEVVTNIKHQILQLKATIADFERKCVMGTSQEDELSEMKKRLESMENAINSKISIEEEKEIYIRHLSNANIVCTTLSSCLKYIDYFDICIIDEATQSTEPWTLVPLKFGVTSLILVGDTQQLPAIVLSKKANDSGLGNSLFTRIQRSLEFSKSNNIIFSLKTQYRMHPEICKWPNSYFYKNELINDPCTMNCELKLVPFSILNLEYSQNINCSSGKIMNDMEAAFITNLVKVLNTHLPTKSNTYGIITPYAEQRKKLESSIRTAGLQNIMINTIDFYQGIEKDVIIISNARTNGIGFLANHQRLNVALTRPKKCLILCGNFKNVEGVTSWKSLLNNARGRNLYHEINGKDALEIENFVIDKLLIRR